MLSIMRHTLPMCAVLQALNEYSGMCKVLRGDFPNKGLLGNCPPGYLAARLHAFAADTCCGAFVWNGGGRWQGHKWTADLPTDTHVLLYLLAAFLSAPFWRFAVRFPTLRHPQPACGSIVCTALMA